MGHLPGRAESRPRIFRKLLWLGVVTALAGGCASQPRSGPVVDAQGRLQGRGFTVTPPQGKDWKAAEKAYDGVVYIKSSEAGDRQDDAKDDSDQRALVHASLGVVALPANGTASAGDQAAFVKAAQNFLSNRFIGQPRISLTDLKTEPYSLNDAWCARFEAVQVERHSSRRGSLGRLEFQNRGFLCRHPDNRTVVIHGFFNEVHHRLAPRPPDSNTEEEADRFLESVVFSPLN